MKKLLLGASVMVLLALAAEKGNRAELQLEAAVNKEVVAGDLKGAIELYRKAAQSSDRAVAAKALLRLGECYEKLGDAEARKAYERLVKEFADQKEQARDAQARLAAMGGKQQETGIVARQIAKIGDRNFPGVLSRDGRYTAFTLPRGVFLRDMVSGEERQLVQRTNPQEAFDIAIVSPDGRHVAYATMPAKGGPFIQLIGVDGSNPHLLAVGGEGTARPWAWTPDGKQLLVARFRKEGPPERVLVSVAGDSQTVLGVGPIPQARFSPDGSQIAFTQCRDQKSCDVALLPVRDGAGSAPVKVAANANTPVWTPDGRRLLFISDHNGSNDLWSIRIEGGKPVGGPEFVKGGVDGLFDVSPEGDCFYRTRNLVRDLFTAGIDPRTGKLTEEPKQITQRDTNYGAAWSPNGEYLAYYQWRKEAGEYKVVIRSMKTGEDRELPLKELLALYSHKPQWFPDNRALFIHYGAAGKLGRFDIQTGEFRPVLESVAVPLYNNVGNAFFRTFIVLAPDGRAIYYLAQDREKGGTRILRRNLDGGPEVEISRIDSDSVQGLAIAPDGSRLAVLVPRPPRDQVIMTLAASGGEPREVYAAKPGRWPHDVMWSRDGRRLFFLLGYGKGEVLSIPAEGGEPQPLGIDMHDLYFLNLHPDGKQIIFADEQWNHHLWVVKNLFPPAKPAR